MVGKAARAACWYEKLKKMYPIDDEGVNAETCNMNQRYDGLYEEKKQWFTKETQRINPGFSLVKIYFLNPSLT